jgi:signal transduction histidine kinase
MGHIWVGHPADPSSALPADARPAPDLYGEGVARTALRSFWAEPRAPDPPAPGPRDWALVAVVAAAGILEAVFREDLVLPGVALLFGLAPVVALPWRRKHPLVVTAVVIGAVTLGEVVTRISTGDPMELFAIAYVLLLPYALFRWGSGREAVIGMAIVLAGQLPTAITTSVGDAVGTALFLSLPGALGASVRYRTSSRRRAKDEVKLRERAQLARELHDTVAHHVSAIAIQAQAGRTVSSEPGAAADALRAIEEEASRTLTEMRAMVGALRQGEEPELAPQRGVADIERLARHTGDGPRVEVALAGDLGRLRPSVDAAIYRLAQESITNALRHARHATRVDVGVTGDDASVRLTVRDDGDPGPSGADWSAGYGLVGMTERAALLGGTLEAGPSADGGWTVTAVLPRNGRPR